MVSSVKIEKHCPFCALQESEYSHCEEILGSCVLSIIMLKAFNSVELRLPPQAHRAASDVTNFEALGVATESLFRTCVPPYLEQKEKYTATDAENFITSTGWNVAGK